MQLTLHTNREVFDQLRGEWDALLHRSTADLIFLTWMWQSVWWDAYEAGDLWIVCCRTDEGRLVAIAPWFVEVRDDERVLRTIGCVDVTDYVDVIVDSDYIEAALSALSEFLAQHRQDYTRINLCNIQQNSPTLAVFPEHLRAAGFEAEVVQQEVCPIIKLPDTWEGYLEQLDKKQRHEIRRKIRRAEEEHVEWYVVGPQHDIEVESEKFIGLMRASHPEKAQFLENPKNMAFFRAILRATYACNWLKLSFLLVNDSPSAAYCDFDYGGRVLVYNSGLQPDQNANFSPGIVLLAYDIRDAIEARRSVFDFLRGDETYKYRMGAQDTQVFKLKAS